MPGYVNRRNFLAAGVAASASLAFPLKRAASEQAVAKRRIFAVGGQAFSDPGRVLLHYLLSLTGKNEPTVYYLPTAAGDNPAQIAGWYEIATQAPCRPRHLRLFDGSGRMKNIEKQLLSADAIWVGGGNTLNMLAIWKAQEVDVVLRKAWEQGVVLAGESAGMICWFEEGNSDSRPERLTVVKGLGFLKGSACPHYSPDSGRGRDYHRMLADGEIKEGIGCDDGAGVLFEGAELTKVISVSSNASAYRVRIVGDKAVAERLRPEVLTSQTNPS
jgi:peptidase E